MKIVWGSLLVCTLSALGLTAQSSDKYMEKVADTTEVAMVVDALSKAMVDRDGAALDELTMTELTYGHSSGRIQTKKEFIDEVVEGPFDFIKIAPTGQTIFIVDDMAVVRHIFNCEATNEGEPVTIRIGSMLVLKKQEDHWRLLARQAYKL